MNDGDKKKTSRLGTVGGQAVIEGVMMKSADTYSIAIRNADGLISVIRAPFEALGERHQILRLPIVRGMVNFFQMLRLGNKALTVSIEVAELPEEESKFEKWLALHCGESISKLIMPLSTILGFGLSIALFSALPAFLAITIEKEVGVSIGAFKNVLEGIMRIGIFFIYLLVISLIKDMRRVFEYHGAEHKTIFCYEAKKPLTPENVQTFKRFHPRCGTSFLFVMMLLGIALFSLPLFPWSNLFLRVTLKLAFFPVLAGLGYEFIRYAGKHDNRLTRIVSAPGLWMQRITTREPDRAQVEVAIAALQSTLKLEAPADRTNNDNTLNRIEVS